MRAVRDGISSASTSVNILDYAPGVFTYARTPAAQDPIVVYGDNSLVTPNRPASPNDVLVIYAAGIGLLTNPPATGAAAPSSPLAAAATLPVITLGGNPAEVNFAGLTPGAVGLAQCNVRLPSNLAQGPTLPLVVRFGAVSSPVVQLPVRGSAPPAPPAIAVSPASLDFGSVAAGQTKELALAVRNTGGSALSVRGITSGDAQFRVGATALPFAVPAGAEQPVSVRFTPAAAGTQATSLTIDSDDPVKPRLTVPVTGAGTAAPPTQDPQITVDPESLEFGVVAVGQTKDLTFTLRNTGGGTLTINVLNHVTWRLYSDGARAPLRHRGGRPAEYPGAVCSGDPGQADHIAARSEQ